MTKKEIEELLRKGAYGALMDDDKAGDEFCEEDIDQILQQRTKVIQIESEGKGSTFAKVSFISVSILLFHCCQIKEHLSMYTYWKDILLLKNYLTYVIYRIALAAQFVLIHICKNVIRRMYF